MSRPTVHVLWAAVFVAALIVVAAIRHDTEPVPGSAAAAGEESPEVEEAASPVDGEAAGARDEAKESDEKASEEKAHPPKWDRPRFEDRREQRLKMVSVQIARRDVKAPATLDAMRQVPRHLFVPADERKMAYVDSPLPIGFGQTISQPYVVAFMTEHLRLKPGDKVLEVGTGSAYQAAVLSELTPHVFTIEIIKPLAEQATKRLRTLGYKTVKVRHADGYYGWPEHAPFDAIIVTAAAGHVPPPLIEQLKPEGRMIIPVGGVFQPQNLIVVTKGKDGQVKTRSVLPVRFVPMTGRAQKKP